MLWNKGIKSNIKSLNLSPAESQTCMASQSCALATIKWMYLGKFGQMKLDASVTRDLCFDRPGCKLAYKYLPPDVTSLECKVL